MREKIADKKERILKIIEIFGKVYSDADCTLEYDNPLQLLISTQLAAQCTDKRVNIVTKDLYKKYRDVYDFANADELELREDIKSTGFFRNKAKNIIGCCKMLISDYNGEVPREMEDLLKLPGVGRKTANLVRGDYFGIPGIVVDTHATRLSNTSVDYMCVYPILERIKAPAYNINNKIRFIDSLSGWVTDLVG